MDPRRKRQLFLLVIFVILPAGVLLLRNPILGVVRSWRYGANLTKAEKALADGDLQHANQFVSAAMRLKPTDLEAMRTLMGLAIRIGSPELPTLALARFTHPEATLADQVAVLNYGLGEGNLVFFSKLYESLDEKRRAEPDVQFCYAGYLERTGRILEAVELVTALRWTSRGPEAKYQLTRLLSAMKDNPVAAKQIRELVLELMEAGDPNALAAFRNLQSLPPAERPLSGGPELQGWVAAQEGAQPIDHLLAAEIEMTDAAPAKIAVIVDALVERYRDSQPHELARWLLRIGQSKRILDLPEEVVRSDESFYAAYLQVLIDDGRFDETRAWIDHPHPKFNAVLLDAVRGGLAFQQQDESGRVSHWQRGFEKARFAGSYGPWVAMLQIARRFGDAAMAHKISGEIIRMPPRLLPATRQLEFLVQEFGAEVETLEDFFVRLEASRPSDPLARHHLARIRIVCGGDLSKAVATLEELARAYDQVLMFDCSLALGYLAQGEISKAHDLLRGQKVNWNEVGPYERAVYAAVARRAGEERTAQALEGAIDWRQLPVFLRSDLQPK